MNMFLLQAGPEGPQGATQGGAITPFLLPIIISLLFMFLGIKIGKLIINSLKKEIYTIIGIGACIFGITLILINISNIVDLEKLIEFNVGIGAVIRSYVLIILGVLLSAMGITCIISKKKNIIEKN